MILLLLPVKIHSRMFFNEFDERNPGQKYVGTFLFKLSQKTVLPKMFRFVFDEEIKREMKGVRLTVFLMPWQPMLFLNLHPAGRRYF